MFLSYLKTNLKAFILLAIFNGIAITGYDLWEHPGKHSITSFSLEVIAVSVACLFVFTIVLYLLSLFEAKNKNKAPVK